jgi:hypothetical protein
VEGQAEVKKVDVQVRLPTRYAYVRYREPSLTNSSVVETDSFELAGVAGELETCHLHLLAHFAVHARKKQSVQGGKLVAHVAAADMFTAERDFPSQRTPYHWKRGHRQDFSGQSCCKHASSGSSSARK